MRLGWRLQARGEFFFLELEGGTRVLEVETLRQLAIRLVHGIDEFVRVELGYGVEGGHVWNLRRVESFRVWTRRPGRLSCAGSRAPPARSAWHRRWTGRAC